LKPPSITLLKLSLRAESSTSGFTVTATSIRYALCLGFKHWWPLGTDF
jgi:hypothetical protein